MLRVWAPHSQVDASHHKNRLQKVLSMLHEPNSVSEGCTWPSEMMPSSTVSKCQRKLTVQLLTQPVVSTEGLISGENVKRQLGVQLRLTITDTRKVLAGDLEIPPVALNREKLSIFIPSVKKNLKKLALGTCKHSWLKQYFPTLDWHFSFTS